MREIPREAVDAAREQIRHRYGIRGDLAVIDLWAADAGFVVYGASSVADANDWIELTQARAALTAALPHLLKN
jgi:hypothetical protein